MKQTKLRKFCIGIASGLPVGFHGIESFMDVAKQIERFIIGSQQGEQASPWPPNETPKLEKATIGVFQDVFYKKVLGGKLLDVDVERSYKKYLTDKYIYDVDHWLELSMRHQSSMGRNLYLRPIIVDPAVKETYTAEIQNPNEDVTEVGIVVSLETSSNTEIVITYSELRLLLQACEYFSAARYATPE